MPDDNTLHQSVSDHAVAIAVLQADARNNAQRMTELTAAVAALAIEVGKSNTILSEAKGGWRMLMLVGGAGSIVGAAFWWLVHHLVFTGSGA